MLVKRLKEFLKDASFYGLSQVLGRLVGFLLIPLYTKYLTPADYGILTLLGFYTLFYLPLSHLGMQGAMFRYVGFSESEENEEVVFSTALTVNLLVGLLFVCIAFIFIPYLEEILLHSTSYRFLLQLTIVSSFFTSINSMGYSFLRIKRRVKLIFFLNLSSLLLNVGLNIYLIVFLGLGIEGAVIAILGSTILSLILLLGVAKIKFRIRFEREMGKKMLNYGLPNVPGYVQAVIMMIFGQYMLNRMVSPADLGFYAVAWKFSLPLQMLLGITHNSWKAYKFDLNKKVQDDRSILGQFTTLMILGYCLLYLLIALWGPDLLISFTASDFHEAAKYVPYLALIPLANALYLVFGSFVSFGESQKLQPFIASSGMIVTVACSFWLIPLYTINGVAIATALGWAIMSILAYCYGQYLFKVNFRLKYVLPIITLSVFCGSVLLDYQDSWPWKIGVVFLHMMASLFVLKHVTSFQLKTALA